jgi:hypothetical protein
MNVSEGGLALTLPGISEEEAHPDSLET